MGKSIEDAKEAQERIEAEKKAAEAREKAKEQARAEARRKQVEAAQENFKAAKEAESKAQTTRQADEDAAKKADRTVHDFVEWSNALKSELNESQAVESIESQVKAKYDQDVAKATAELNATIQKFEHLHGSADSTEWKALYAKEQAQKQQLQQLEDPKVLSGRMVAASQEPGANYRKQATGKIQAASAAVRASKIAAASYKAAQEVVGVRASICDNSYDEAIKKAVDFDAQIASATNYTSGLITDFDSKVTASIRAKYAAKLAELTLLRSTVDLKPNVTPTLLLVGVLTVAIVVMLAWVRRRGNRVYQQPLLG